MEVKRQLDVLDRRLGETEFVAGAEYSIADMAIWPWYGGLVKGWLYGAAEFLDVQSYQHVQRWAETIGERPAVKRGRIVNRTQGDPASQLWERHEADDFDTSTQDKVATAPQGYSEAGSSSQMPPALELFIIHQRPSVRGDQAEPDTPR
jgi:GST-like protein